MSTCDYSGPRFDTSFSRLQRSALRSPLDGMGPMAPTPDEELREAFRRHGESVGRRWRATIYGISRQDGELLTVRVDLTCDDARALGALIRAETGSRGDVTGTHFGTAAVARHIHVSPSTIRAWLARNGPSQNPFPRPEKLLGRSRWRQAAIDAWQLRQEQIKNQNARRHPQSRNSRDE